MLKLSRRSFLMGALGVMSLGITACKTEDEPPAQEAGSFTIEGEVGVDLDVPDEVIVGEGGDLGGHLVSPEDTERILTTFRTNAAAPNVPYYIAHSAPIISRYYNGTRWVDI